MHLVTVLNSFTPRCEASRARQESLMVAAYEILPSVDLEEAAGEQEQQQSSFMHRLRSVSCACNFPSRVVRAHADTLDTTWLTELDRLGAHVFVCFLLLRSASCSLHYLASS